MMNAFLYVCTGLLISGGCLAGCGIDGTEAVGVTEEALTNPVWEAPPSAGSIALSNNGVAKLTDSGFAICQLFTSGGLHPGKVFNSTCRVEWGGNMVQSSTYNALRDNGYTWQQVNYNSGNPNPPVFLPEKAVLGGSVGPGAGSTPSDQPMGICEAFQNGNWHGGKYWHPVGFFPRCQYEFNGTGTWQELNINVGNNIKVLVKP